ncbi:hypothetical protein PHYPSEUDO_002648 [Phytophthora pseudosyringae]|uniref:M96 mating-specific protein family n=1 Tax=Phytophthora pseudosyringae TaxID=221518 RepID=A0A8T1VT14_9STRA|nr:hypothetical protein PHYPSEUDO_002648 [Phytophthora pseudosyringae]
MANESPLADVLAFLDELPAEPLPLLDNCDDWDPNLLLETLEGDTEVVPTRNSTVDLAIPDQTLTPQGSAGPDPTQTHEQRSKTKKNKNKARDERRFVLIQLRDEVEKLEFTLKQVQKMRSTQQKTIGHSTQGSEEDRGVPAVWQDICSRQLRQRLTAERENVHLKQELEREKQRVKSVQKLLYKRRVPKATGPEADRHTRRTSAPPGYIERMAAFIFDELAAGVEIMHCQLRDALEARRAFPTVERPLFQGGVEGDEETLFDRRVLSFSLHAAGDAWWQTWHSHRGRSVHESLGDTVVETFGVEMDDFNANTTASSYGQQVLRRNVEDHRVVYVWSAYLEPFIFENERVGGIYFLEQCHVFIKSEDRDTAVTEEGEFSTSMSTCYTITPYFLTTELRDEAKARALVDFFLSSILSTMKTRSEMAENLLLDQALEKHTFG